MIRNTFIFIPGIGEKTERHLWRKGILTWDDLKNCVNGLTKTRKEIIKEYLEKASIALSKYDSSFFAKLLPQKEYWRVYKDFRAKTLFLDIETTGLSLYYDKITIIGTFDGSEYNVFLRDVNLDEFEKHIKGYKVLVTFNGKLFDIPFIRKEFPNLELPKIHIDLKYILRSFGITGPLKEVEKKLGIYRPEYIQETNGKEAAILWNKFTKGDYEALKKLILYNILDTINLQKIMHICYQKKINQIKRNLKVQQKLVRVDEDSKLPTPNFKIPEVIIKYSNSKNGFLYLYVGKEKMVKINKNKINNTGIKIGDIIQKIEKKGITPVSVGIDLSASKNRNTGICILKNNTAYLDIARTDCEIISKVINAKPVIVSIDSPLSLPKGRCCVNDTCECRKYGITRECERILKRRGINIYPCLIKSMQALTLRGIKIAKLIREQGYKVIESYPGAAQDILGLPRKRIDLTELKSSLVDMGINIVSNRKNITHDEIDALTSALVGYFYLTGEYEAIGNADEGYLIIPRYCHK